LRIYLAVLQKIPEGAQVGQPAIYVARERFVPDFGILGYIRFDCVLSNTAAIKHLVQA
tara:strand:+ start:311 stop:484 length:174 start_codon:yes stop_codon:yes gene_type:complete